MEQWICAILALTLSLGASANALGPLADPNYGGGNDGIARAVLGANNDDEAMAALALPDGGLLIGGNFRTPADEFGAAFVRFTPAGVLDTNFGPNHDGRFIAGFAPANLVDVAAAPDAKTLFAGLASGAAMVGRLTGDGLPDASFNNGGQRFIGANAFVDGAGSAAFGRVIALPGGKILAVGDVAAVQPGPICAVIARLTDTGAFDETFASNKGHLCIAPAIASTPLMLEGDATVLEDGSVLVAGGAVRSGGSGFDMAIARVTSAGELDSTFGPAHDGWTFVAFDRGGTLNDFANAISIDTQGRIVIAGFFADVNGTTGLGIARLSAEGQLDAAFGTQGLVMLEFDHFSNAVNSIRALRDGHILIGATASTLNGTTGAAVMLRDNGELEPRFGQDGIFYETNPDIAATELGAVSSARQILSGDYLYMVGPTYDTTSGFEFGATRFVLPIFNDGFAGSP